ncbi:unnamed protein product [Clonostachys rosea f. rosea IK726]|uniref:Uncharacterized protein n=1 Tax=Clonostachys rosea f. rosea IK726 TaxID=1349383 RepID=A0ACA9T9C5_BIOOC|nr:unnamed protein product [Clonostachys rosea f. rosea IK726]
MGAIFADDSSTNPQNISNRSYEASMDRFHETRGMGAALATGCRIRANLVMVLQCNLDGAAKSGVHLEIKGSAKLDNYLELNGFERDV